MHYFHAITPIMLLFHESRPEKMASHAITPCITFTPSRQFFLLFHESRPEKMAKYVIMPTAGGASLINQIWRIFIYMGPSTKFFVHFRVIFALCNNVPHDFSWMKQY